eukprot:781418-Pelagomonas_calceolata.AAC.1
MAVLGDQFMKSPGWSCAAPAEIKSDLHAPAPDLPGCWAVGLLVVFPLPCPDYVSRFNSRLMLSLKHIVQRVLILYKEYSYCTKSTKGIVQRVLILYKEYKRLALNL